MSVTYSEKLDWFSRLKGRIERHRVEAAHRRYQRAHLRAFGLSHRRWSLDSDDRLYLSFAETAPAEKIFSDLRSCSFYLLSQDRFWPLDATSSDGDGLLIPLEDLPYPTLRSIQGSFEWGTIWVSTLWHMAERHLDFLKDHPHGPKHPVTERHRDAWALTYTNATDITFIRTLPFPKRLHRIIESRVHSPEVLSILRSQADMDAYLKLLERWPGEPIDAAYIVAGDL